MAAYHQGRFRPKNPRKYRGDPTRIVYRSSWELKMFRWLDAHPHVVCWASEEPWMIVNYRNPLTGKVHRYFPDLWVRKHNGDPQQLETMMIEIKPREQMTAPRTTAGKSRSRKNLKAVATYAINHMKWEAARAHCSAKGWEFKIMNEHDLGMLG